MSRNLTDKARKVLVAILTFVVLIAFVGLWRSEMREKEMLNHSNSEKDLDAMHRREGWIEYNGDWYKPNSDIEKYLIIGVDSDEPLKDYGSYGNYNQADFLLLLIMNKADKTTTLFQINRDTMTEIPVLGITGQFAGTVFGQLALAHTYGNGLEESCKNTVSAVEGLLGGVGIDHYISMNMGVIPYLNDMIGGIEVTVEDDFSGIDPYLVKGETVLLEGQHALNYLRVRKGLEDSSNINRMNRHKQYLEKLVGNAEKISTIMVTSDQAEYLSQYICSDCTINALDDLAKSFVSYKLNDYVLIEGEAKKGTEFIEFYPDEERLTEQVLNLFYVLR